jgi:hypothetical protein
MTWWFRIAEPVVRVTAETKKPAAAKGAPKEYNFSAVLIKGNNIRLTQ